MKTITRSDVAEAIYEEIGLSRKDSSDILDMILDEIVSVNGEVCTMRGKKIRSGDEVLLDFEDEQYKIIVE